MRPVQRREALAILSGALLPFRATAAVPRRPARDAVDHVVIGIADLDRGMDLVAARTGVRPSIGGSHPGRGTWNALFSLGPGQYAELIAPDPKQAGTPDAYGLSAFAEPRLLMWAASTTDIEALAAALRSSGHSDGAVRPGARVKPDGRRLSWRTLGARGDDGLTPFFIQWDAGTPHPSADSPAGCRLDALTFEAPDPEGVASRLAALGLDARVERAEAPRLRAALSTPLGPVAF
jgi:hypothetical protein